MGGSLGKLAFVLGLLVSGFFLLGAISGLSEGGQNGLSIVPFCIVMCLVCLPYTWRLPGLQKLRSGRRWALGSVLAVAALVISSTLKPHDASTTAASSAPVEGGNTMTNIPPPAPSASPADLMKQGRPADEVAFITAVDQGKSAAKQAANDMAKGGTRAVRKTAICAALPSHDIADWTGKITELSSNSEGKGVLAIDIDDGITLVTWNNALSDTSDQTLIDPSSSLFKTVSSLKEGDAIKFSGSFIDSDEDCVEENSLLSVEESMSNPHFIMRFSSAKQLEN